MAEEPEINKRVEILRSLLRTKEQFDELFDEELVKAFSDKDKEFMEEFKKIYHIGVSQLEKFINKIDEEGNEISIESIQYYKSLLFTGPLAANAISLARPPEEAKKFFKINSDIFGTNGNLARSDTTVPLFKDGGEAFNNSLVTSNKSTAFINGLINIATKKTAEVVNETSLHLTDIDNTLPFIDKKQPERKQKEQVDGFDTESHGCYGVADVEFFKVVEEISDDIFEKVKEYLGEEDFEVYKFLRLINYFDSEKNKAKAIRAAVKKKLVYMTRSYTEEGIEEIEIKDTILETDLIGNQFESDKRREFTFKIQGDDDKIFTVNTVEGQLGSGEEVKEEPITD
mgnify:FL=1|jgi:hypothetical protein